MDESGCITADSKIFLLQCMKWGIIIEVRKASPYGGAFRC